MAYAFCLAGKAEICESFLRELQKSAKEVGEFQLFQDFGRWEDGIDLTDGMCSNLDNIESISTWIFHQTSQNNSAVNLQHICCSIVSSYEKETRTYYISEAALSSDSHNPFSSLLTLSLFIQVVQSTGSRSRDPHPKNPPSSLTMPHQLKLRSLVMFCWHCSTNPTGIKRISHRPQELCSGSSGNRIPMEVSLPHRWRNSLPLPSQS